MNKIIINDTCQVLLCEHSLEFVPWKLAAFWCDLWLVKGIWRVDRKTIRHDTTFMPEGHILDHFIKKSSVTFVELRSASP